MNVSVFLDVDEWRRLGDLLGTSLHPAENPPIGHLQLRVRGTHRTWAATDRRQLAVHRCEGTPATDDDGRAVHELDVLVNPRLLRGIEPSDAVLVVSVVEGARTVTLEIDGFVNRLPEHPGVFPDWEPALADVEGRTVASATVEQESLVRLCVAAGIVPPGFDEPELVAVLRIADGTVAFEVPWSTIPSTVVGVRADEGAGGGALWIDPRRLHSLIGGLPDGPVELRMLADEAGLVLRAEEFEALLFPVDMLAGPRARLEDLLRAFLVADDLIPDEDGDYVVRVSEDARDGHVYVRLDHPELPTVRVFSVLADDVDPSPELYAELNSINAGTPQLKVIHASDAVMAEIEIVATNLDMDELAAAINRVRDAASGYRPLLEAFFGGSAEEPG